MCCCVNKTKFDDGLRHNDNVSIEIKTRCQ